MSSTAAPEALASRGASQSEAIIRLMLVGFQGATAGRLRGATATRRSLARHRRAPGPSWGFVQPERG